MGNSECRGRGWRWPRSAVAVTDWGLAGAVLYLLLPETLAALGWAPLFWRSFCWRRWRGVASLRYAVDWAIFETVFLLLAVPALPETAAVTVGRWCFTG